LRSAAVGAAPPHRPPRHTPLREPLLPAGRRGRPPREPPLMVRREEREE
jgi:hypothetical protein